MLTLFVLLASLSLTLVVGATATRLAISHSQQLAWVASCYEATFDLDTKIYRPRSTAKAKALDFLKKMKESTALLTTSIIVGSLLATGWVLSQLTTPSAVSATLTF